MNRVIPTLLIVLGLVMLFLALAAPARAQSVIMFVQPGCKPCAEMKKELVESREVVPIEYMDVFENKAFADQLGVKTTPSFIAIDKNRNTKSRLLEGKQPVAALVSLYGAVAPRQSPDLPAIPSAEELVRTTGGSSGAIVSKDVQALRIELGRKLFFDKRISINGTTSCASCHDPARGYSDGRAVAVGLINPATNIGLNGVRNTPTILAAGKQPRQFWDGRAGSLEEQALGPIANPNEMGDQTVGQVMDRLRSIPGYRQLFQAAFGRDLNRNDFGAALAAFERTLISRGAPIDKFRAGRSKSMSEAALRGLAIATQVKCFDCHNGDNYGGQVFANNGYSARTVSRDRGLAAANIDGRVVGPGVENRNERAFKVPTLREIMKTAPYMHDGGLRTLQEVVDHYGSGGRFQQGGQLVQDSAIDKRVANINLTVTQRKDLLAFLQEAFVGDFPRIEPPVLP